MAKRSIRWVMFTLLGLSACDVTAPDLELDPSQLIVASVTFAGSDTIRLFLGRMVEGRGTTAGLADRMVEVRTPHGVVTLEPDGECGTLGFPGACFTSALPTPLSEGDVLELSIENAPSAIVGRTAVPARPATENAQDPIVVSERHLDNRLIVFDLPRIIEQPGRVELESGRLIVFRPDAEATECPTRSNPPEGFDLAEGEIVQVRVFPQGCGPLIGADSIVGHFHLVRYDPELSRMREALEGADEVRIEDASAGIENAFGFFGAAAATPVHLRVR